MLKASKEEVLNKYKENKTEATALPILRISIRHVNPIKVKGIRNEPEEEVKEIRESFPER